MVRDTVRFDSIDSTFRPELKNNRFSVFSPSLYAVGRHRAQRPPPDLIIHRLHSHTAFLSSGHSKRFTTLPNIHPFIHTFTHRRWSQPRKATASSSGAVRASCSTLRETGGRTSNLPATSQPSLPPKPRAEAHRLTCLVPCSRAPAGVLTLKVHGVIVSPN